MIFWETNISNAPENPEKKSAVDFLFSLSTLLKKTPLF